VSNTKDNPPCNTLFVGNLGDTVDEAELNGIFASQPVSGVTLSCYDMLKHMTLEADVTLVMRQSCTAYPRLLLFAAVGSACNALPRLLQPCIMIALFSNAAAAQADADLACLRSWLSLLLLHSQGFQQLKVLRSARNISCFVEFETVETAMQCHSTQQVRGPGQQRYSCRIACTALVQHAAQAHAQHYSVLQVQCVTCCGRINAFA
jgi:hypothetical protein